METVPSGKKLYPYDYGYSTTQKRTAPREVQHGENKFKLGAKLDQTFHKNTLQVSKEPTIKSVESMSETWKPPTKTKQFIDPRKYIRDNDIICKKFNYSVPQSFDDKKALIKLSDDQ